MQAMVACDFRQKPSAPDADLWDAELTAVPDGVTPLQVTAPAPDGRAVDA